MKYEKNYVFYCLNKNRYGDKNMFVWLGLSGEGEKVAGRISMVSERA